MRKVPADLHRWLPAVGLVLLALVGEAVEAKKCGKTTSIWTGKAISRTQMSVRKKNSLPGFGGAWLLEPDSPWSSLIYNSIEVQQL